MSGDGGELHDAAQGRVVGQFGEQDRVVALDQDPVGLAQGRQALSRSAKKTRTGWGNSSSGGRSAGR